MNDGRIDYYCFAWNPFCFGIVGYDGGMSGMAIWVNADEMIERLKWDFDDEYAKSIVGDVASFNADMVEVVRCKDCKYCTESFDESPCCGLMRTALPYVREDDFCSFGERRTDD